ncbi:hypothetical protein ABZ915_17780 [Streptomyces sp. NPDC046915]|uniref:hypothetical protein n=1 Tax=Streptomyces sp. NPDC046915 TaxID=3155257 RepID=UPI0033D5E263
MTALVTQVVPNVGADIFAGLVASTASDTAATGAGTFLVVRNKSGAAVTVTVTTPGQVDGRLAIADSVSPNVVATDGVGIIPLPTALYADPTTGLATIAVSAPGATVLVGVVRVP